MWRYICFSSGDEYLAHSAKGSTWNNHKYIKKENGRYYYADEKGNKGGKVNTGDFTASDGPAYMLDEGDKEYMENHRNGTDTRTHDEYMADKKAAIAAADKEETDKQAQIDKAKARRQANEEERKKKELQENVLAAGEDFIKRHM